MTICPTTAEDWEQAEQKKSCATGIYHCLRTQLNFLIEVCAPENTLIRPGGCPYWNINGNVDMVDCTRFSQCPDTPFLSNEVYQYPFCYQSWSTTTTYSTTSEVSDTTTNMLTSSTVSAERREYEHLWLFVSMVILSCAVVLVLLHFIIRYHLRVGRRQKDQKIPTDGGELTSERYILLDQMILPDGGELTSERYILLVEDEGKEITEDPEIPVNNGELTNEPSTQIPPLEPETPVNDEVLSKETSTQTPFLDGEKEEDKNKIATEEKEIKEEPETPVNDGVLSEETSTQTPFLEAQKEKEKNEIATEEKEIKEGLGNPSNGQNIRQSALARNFDRSSVITAIHKTEQRRSYDSSVFFTDKYRKEQKWNGAISFFFTDAYKEGIDTLKDEDILVIKGSPGSGKTSMSMQIMRQHDEQDWSCEWIDNVKNFDVVNISRKTIFVMDNCFGTWNNNPNDRVYERVKKVLCSILDKINQDHICKMVFIMTKEESVWYWNSLCSECPKLGRSKVIDMDSEQSFQKKDLVQYFTSNFTRDGCKRNVMKLGKSIRRLVKDDRIGFPLKVKLLCGIPNITFKSFCRDALGCLKKHFNGMRTASDDTEKLKYAMLTYVLLKGRLSQKFSFDMQLGHRLNKSLNKENLKSSLPNLKPYLKKDEHDFFVFEHAVLYIALFKDFYDADEITLLEHCNIDAIQQIVRPHSSRDGRFCLNVMIDIESIKVLAYRIRQEGLKDDFKDHILFKKKKEFKKLLD